MLRIPFKTRLSLFAALSVAAIGAFLLSCREKPTKHTFSEVNGFDSPLKRQEIKLPETMSTEASMGSGDASGAAVSPHADHAGGKLTWNLPEGWNAHVGSGMFYAIVKTSPRQDANEAGIVMLAGEAGGLEANVERWLGQLGVQLTPEKMKAFIDDRKTLEAQGNLKVTCLDFTPVVANGESQCMLVGIVKPKENSYFVKLKGTQQSLLSERGDFVKFLESLRFE